MDNANKTIKIAVSSCLAGYCVRYDGKNKLHNVIQQLCKTFDCIAICPESNIGLGTPRPPLNLIKVDNDLRARGKTNPFFDITDDLRIHAEQIAEQYQDICGYIFKSRSPSCGVDSTPWNTINGTQSGLASGIFSAQIRNLLPSLPIIEDVQLNDNKKLEAFIEDVTRYASVIKSI